MKKYSPLKIVCPLFFAFILVCYATISLGAGAKTTAELKQQANNNSVDAQYLLGYRYEMGINARRNHKTAIGWYQKAARKQHLDAQYRLGALYYRQQQYTKARYWLAKRAKSGHSGAQYYYANTFRYALGTKEQTSTARRWYTKAATQGHAKAQYELGLLYKKGIGAKKNTDLANQWFKKSATQGEKRAKKQLKSAQRSNIKPQKKIQQKKEKIKPTKKHIDITKNALLGKTEQQYELGMRYLLGYQTELDKKQAIYWLKKAAEQNHPLALYQMANQYLNGKLVKKDTDLAIKYYSAASKQHVETAKTALKHLTEGASSNPQ